MKVDLVTPRFHPSVGGIEESVTQLALGLLKRGHEVVVHTARLGNDPTGDEWRGIPIRRYNFALNRGFYVSRFEPTLSGDVLHLHAYAHQTNDWVIREHRDKPIVYSTHHGIRFPKKGIVARLYHWWYNRRTGLPNLRSADRVLVPTRIDREEFARRGVDMDRIDVVPSGVDDAAFGGHPAWRPAGIKGEFLLFLGRIHEEKGVADLVRAHESLKERLPLVIAGNDEGGLRRVKELPKDVRVVSGLTVKQKWGLLEACRGLVLPSHYEGQGIVVAEAWAKAKPVVATRAGGLAAVVKDGSTGILVDVGDIPALAKAMRRITTSDAAAQRLGAAGRAEADKSYRWPRIVDQVEAIYLDALKARR